MLLPWVALYEFTVAVQDSGCAFVTALDSRLPLWPETIAIYASSYLTVPLAPWLARSTAQLRALMLRSWAATLTVFPFYWLVPSTAPRPPLEPGGWFERWLLWERGAYPPVAAFPAFHVIWAMVIVPLVRPRWLGPAYAALVSISCLTTRQHYTADVAAGLAVGALLLSRPLTAVVAGLVRASDAPRRRP